jgi:peptidoglycan/xylan/chitin deacetylase (PgdA/CDA1 family)
MQYVANNLRPMTLDSFQHHLTERKPFPSRSCLITFDDGWIDNYEVAFPVLKTYRIPATIFLPVDYISNDKMFWQEELFMRLDARHEGKDSRQARAQEIRELISRLKQGSTDAIDRALSAARSDTADLDFRGHYNRYLSWPQVAEMQKNGISFGSHACSHRILCNLSDDEQIRELNESKEILEDKLNRQVSALAYPNGDFDSSVVKHSKAAGYTIAFSTIRGFCESDADEFALPRVNIHDQNTATHALFKCTLLGLF